MHILIYFFAFRSYTFLLLYFSSCVFIIFDKDQLYNVELNVI